MVRIGALELGEFPLLLAPMEDVSDPPFRAVCKTQGADLMYTEFISSEGLIRNAHKSMKKLDIYDDERPMGIQIFGGEEAAMVQAIDVVTEARPNLIDINFGCPVKNVVCKEAGSGMLRNLLELLKITEAMVKRSQLPITVKTRLGWDEDSKQIVYLAEALQDIGVQALAVHGRTRVQMYKGEADWALIGEVKNNPRMHIPVFGNGDINTPEKAKLYRERYGVDGIMIGRASIGYPWIFREIKHYFATGEHLAKPDTDERVNVCLQHFERSLTWKGDKLGILEMRRHYTNYFKGYPHFKEIRTRLVTTDDAQEIRDILNDVRITYKDVQAIEQGNGLEEVSYQGCD